MKTTPLIDIIIPNYNKAKYLKECLESVINQTYKNWKIYLITTFLMMILENLNDFVVTII